MHLYFRLTFIENHSVICVEMDDGLTFRDLIKDIKMEYRFSKVGARLVVHMVQWELCTVFGINGKLGKQGHLTTLHLPSFLLSLSMCHPSQKRNWTGWFFACLIHEILFCWNTYKHICWDHLAGQWWDGLWAATSCPWWSFQPIWSRHPTSTGARGIRR